MSDVTAESIQKIMEGLRPDAPERLEELAACYDAEVRFKDPLQTLHGRAEFIEMNRRLLRRSRKLRFEVSHALQSGELIFLDWTLDLAPKLGPSMTFAGATRMRLQSGLVIDHRDYWDLAGGVIGAVPGLRSLYRAALSAIA